MWSSRFSSERPLTGELLPAFRLAEEQLREGEVIAHALFLALQAGDDLVEALGIRPEHRAAAIDRPAVAVDPDDVDVGGALRHLFVEDFRALVDHGVKRPLDDLLVGDVAALDALLFGEIL